MKKITLVTDAESLPIDYDMPLLLEACQAQGFAVDLCYWDDPSVNWGCYDVVVLRSPWSYTKRSEEFLTWCERVSAITQLANPLAVVKWGLDKHYLIDIAAQGVPIVSSYFIDDSSDPMCSLNEFFATYPQTEEIVVKPTIGAYCRNVRRFKKTEKINAAEHIEKLLKEGFEAILQPYLKSIDTHGETNLSYFGGEYSHAICKSAMLMADGSTNVPTEEFRKVRVADNDERAVASATLNALAKHLNLTTPLLQARIDLVRDDDDMPRVLEVEVFEPSLNIPLAEGSAIRFSQSLAKLLI